VTGRSAAAATAQAARAIMVGRADRVRRAEVR
jgi:hypothetical protein